MGLSYALLSFPQYPRVGLRFLSGFQNDDNMEISWSQLIMSKSRIEKYSCFYKLLRFGDC